MLVVYRHTCRNNGKSYIGVSKVSMKSRWQHHCYYSRLPNSKIKTAFHRAIKKHTPDSFDSEVIFCPFTIEDMLWAEAHLVEQHNTLSPCGYNTRAGGEGYTIVSDESRQASSELSKRRWADNRGKMIAAMKRRWENPAYRKIKSDQVSGDKNPMHGTQPWDNPKTKNNIDAIMVWSIADIITENIERNGYASPETVCSRMHETLGRIATVRNIIKRLKNGWQPLKDPAWVDFATNLHQNYSVTTGNNI